MFGRVCERKLFAAYLQNSEFLKCFGIELRIFMEAGIVQWIWGPLWNMKKVCFLGKLNMLWRIYENPKDLKVFCDTQSITTLREVPLVLGRVTVSCLGLAHCRVRWMFGSLVRRLTLTFGVPCPFLFRRGFWSWRAWLLSPDSFFLTGGLLNTAYFYVYTSVALCLDSQMGLDFSPFFCLLVFFFLGAEHYSTIFC